MHDLNHYFTLVQLDVHNYILHTTYYIHVKSDHYASIQKQTIVNDLYLAKTTKLTNQLIQHTKKRTNLSLRRSLRAFSLQAFELDGPHDSDRPL